MRSYRVSLFCVVLLSVSVVFASEKPDVNLDVVAAESETETISAMIRASQNTSREFVNQSIIVRSH